MKPDSRVRLTFHAIDRELIDQAARLQGMKRRPWMTMVVRAEAQRVRLAASNVPQGLHPGARLFRVTDAPAQGAWAYRERLVATGLERIFVTTFLDDAPPGISKDRRAAVVDVVPGGPKNLVVAADGIRWLGTAPAAEWVARGVESDATLADPPPVA